MTTDPSSSPAGARRHSRTSLPRRVVRGVFGVLAAIWMFVEEWLWDRLVRCTQWLAKLPVFRAIEARIQRLSPPFAMATFAIPWLLLLPAKVLGLWLMGSGRFALGVAVFAVAKVVGTAMLARLFTLTKPTLLQVAWFRRLYTWFTGVRDRLYAYVRSLRAWQVTRRWLSVLRAQVRGVWRRLRGG